MLCPYIEIPELASSVDTRGMNLTGAALLGFRYTLFAIHRVT